MKVIQKFEAKDGTEFNTEADCLAHENLLAEVGRIQGVAQFG